MTEEAKVGKGKTLPFIMWFVIGIVLGAGSIFIYNKNMVKSPVNVPNQMDQVQAKELIAKVGKLIILPANEEPMIQIINDASGLAKDKEFFKGSKDTDVILYYQKALKAVVYSPSRNIIVNAGPVFIQNPQEATAEKTVPTETKK